MKRLLVLILTLSLLCSVCGVSFAAQGDTVLYEKKEIKDLNQLRDMADKGVTDSSGDINKFKTKLENAPEGLMVKKSVTTQKLKKVKLSDGTIKTSYVTTAFATVKEKNEPVAVACLSNDFSFLVAASRNWNEPDPGVCIQHVSTYYYDKFTDASNHMWVKPNSISSQWYKLDASTTLQSGTRTGMEWWGHNGSQYTGNTDYLYPTLELDWGEVYNNTCSGVGGSGYIDCTPAGCFVTFQQKSNIRRLNSTWTFISDYMFAENV